METVVACLLIAVFMPLVCAWIGGYHRHKQLGRVDNKHPRIQAAKLEGAGHRAYAAQQNCWEALAVFAAALLALNISGVAMAAVASLSMAFVVLRSLYIAAYLTDQDYLRSSSFLGGLGICVYFFYLALTTV